MLHRCYRAGALLACLSFLLACAEVRTDANVDAGAASASAGSPNTCLSLAGGDSTVLAVTTPGCLGCMIQNADNAADDDRATAASLLVPAAVAGGATLRGTAQPGVVFPAGGLAGVLVQITKLANLEVMGDVGIRTYLQGTLQDDGLNLGPSVAGNGLSGFGTNPRLLLLETTKPYDAVEFAVDAAVGTGITAEVFEFCRDAKL